MPAAPGSAHERNVDPGDAQSGLRSTEHSEQGLADFARRRRYFDRTFVSGLTYSFQGRPKAAVCPHGLMRGKEAHFFYTLDSPALVAFMDPRWLSNYFTVFRYCGFSAVRRHDLARLKLTTQDRRERWLATVQKRAVRIATRLVSKR